MTKWEIQGVRHKRGERGDLLEGEGQREDAQRGFSGIVQQAQRRCIEGL